MKISILHSELEIKTHNMTGTDSICHDRKNAAGSSNYGALSCILQAFVQGPKSLGSGPNVRETSSKVAQLRGGLKQ